MLRLRQLLPLFLEYAGDRQPISGRTRIQKMTFILAHRMPTIDDPYQWQEGPYGPSSAGLQGDLDELLHRGFIREEPDPLPDGRMLFQYRITMAGSALVDRVLADAELERRHAVRAILAKAEEVKADSNRKPLVQLLRETAA